MSSARPLIGGIFVVLVAALSANARASSPQPLHHRLRTTIDDAVTGKGLPSVVVVLFDERHILWSHAAGYADMATKRSPTLTTRYRLGSMAKAVTSTVLAIAAQKHLISFHSRLPVKAAT